MNHCKFGLLIVAGLFLASCAPLARVMEHPTTVFPPTTTQPPPTNTQTQQPSLTPTIASPTPSPSPSSTASPTATPTITPVPTATPIAWGTTILDVDNASSIEQRITWGLGAPESAAYTSDGSIFVQDTPLGVYIYSSESLELIRFISEAREFFLSPDNSLLFTNFPDGTIQVIELPAGETRHVLEPISTLTPWMNDAVYEQIPSVRPAMETMFFKLVTSMSALSVNPDGNLVAIGFGPWSQYSGVDSYTTLGIWDLHTGTLVRQLRTNIVKNISTLVFSPNGEKLLSEGQGGEIAIWRVYDGELLWRLPNIGHIVGQPFSPDGSFIALEISTADPSDIITWVAVRETNFGAEQGSRLVGTVAANAISPDNTHLVTTWWGNVSVWSIPHLQLMHTIRTDLDWPRASFSVDGQHILLNDGEQAYQASNFIQDITYPVPVFQAAPRQDAYLLQQIGHLTGIIGLRFPHQNQAFAWGTITHQVAWVRSLADDTHTFYDFGSPFINAPDLSFSGDRLAACTEAGLVVISVSDGHTTNFGLCRASGVVRFSTDDTRIFRSNGTLVDVIDSTTGELLHNLRGHLFLVEDLAVTQDGAYLVSSSSFQRTHGREIYWWRVDRPSRLWQWWVNVYPDDHLLAAVFQEDDYVLHTALGGLRSWRLGDGIQHHLDTTRIASLAISPNQQLLVSGDYNGVIHLWSLETWQEVATLSGHLQPVNGLIFSPDGNSLLSVSEDGTIRLWGIP